MKPVAALLVLISLSFQVHASGTAEDMAMIKADQAAKKEFDAKYAAQQAENKRQAAIMKQQQDAQNAAAMRSLLGKPAEGKSDAEVTRMYNEKLARDEAKGPLDEAAARDNANASVQGMTGKTMEDMEKMSDQDIDKLEAEILKKYGQ